MERGVIQARDRFISRSGRQTIGAFVRLAEIIHIDEYRDDRDARHAYSDLYKHYLESNDADALGIIDELVSNGQARGMSEKDILDSIQSELSSLLHDSAN